MKKIKLIIREKGRYVQIPGLSSFRTPAKVDVTKIKLSILIQSLHIAGVVNYELVSSSETGETKKYTKDEVSFLEKKKKSSDIDERLDRVEDLLLKLVSSGASKKSSSSEQIDNRLNRIERLLKKGQQVIVRGGIDDSPIVEELDDQYIPEIDIEEMQISGKTIEVVEKKDEKDIDLAASLLSNLTLNGGKK